jgi:cell division protein FtsW
LRNERLSDHRGDLWTPRGPVDVPFLLLTLLLLGIGVVMVLSASYASAYYDVQKITGGNSTYFFTRQLAFSIVGIGAMYIVSRLPMHFFHRISGLVMLAAIALLLAVLAVGHVSGGGRRWLYLGGISVQPSEIAKIAVILYFATLICRIGNYMGTFKYGIVPFVAILAVIVGLLVLEPHFSASVIILMLGAVMMFVGGTRLVVFVLGLIAGGGLLAVMLFSSNYASSRIMTWRDPFSDTSDAGWQIVQSLYAVGSGGLFGLGLGQSRQKYLYLPEEHNDFIFSIICEELGFIGAILILALFALLIIRGYWIALHSRDRYSFLVVTGVTSLLAIQVFLNVAVCTNLIPCTGISLPFFSYGGSALLMQLAEMGIILSASRDVPEKKVIRKRKRTELRRGETVAPGI